MEGNVGRGFLDYEADHAEKTSTSMVPSEPIFDNLASTRSQRRLRARLTNGANLEHSYVLDRYAPIIANIGHDVVGHNELPNFILVPCADVDGHVHI